MALQLRFCAARSRIVADVSANSFGKVALAIELRGQPLFDEGLFVGSKQGIFDERLRNSTSEFDSPSSRMSLNELGQIAFQDNGIVLSNPDGTFRRIVDSNSGSFAVFDPSLNIFGRVAFMGFTNQDPQIQGIFTSRGGPVTTVADSTGAVRVVREAVAERSRADRLHRRSRRVPAERPSASRRLHGTGSRTGPGAAGR